MNNGYIKHEDERRVLYDWTPNRAFSGKAVVAKERIALGDHFHLKKEEIFFLLSGRIEELHLGESIAYNIPAPYQFEVGVGLYHKFVMEPGSILLCVATAPFDPEDEIKKEA